MLLIGTTLEVLASQGRDAFRVARWRKKMGHHVVVVGYGTKGRSAVETLVGNGWDRESIVIVDPSAVALQDAHADGLAVVTGDATRREVLRRAGVAEADQVIITTDRDDSNVLATLTVRQLNPDVYIVAAAREHENAPLMKQSGANSVITSSDAVGRLLGLSSLSPPLGAVMEDLLTYGQGLEVAERELLVTEVGKPPQQLPDQVIAVVRDEKVLPLLRPDGDPARARGPADRGPAGQGAAVGTASGHPQRAAGVRRGADAIYRTNVRYCATMRPWPGEGGGWSKRGSAIPLAERVRTGVPADPPAEGPPCPARHCWVADAADGRG